MLVASLALQALLAYQTPGLSLDQVVLPPLALLSIAIGTRVLLSRPGKAAKIFFTTAAALTALAGDDPNALGVLTAAAVASGSGSALPLVLAASCKIPLAQAQAEIDESGGVVQNQAQDDQSLLAWLADKLKSGSNTVLSNSGLSTETKAQLKDDFLTSFVSILSIQDNTLTDLERNSVRVQVQKYIEEDEKSEKKDALQGFKLQTESFEERADQVEKAVYNAIQYSQYANAALLKDALYSPQRFPEATWTQSFRTLVTRTSLRGDFSTGVLWKEDLTQLDVPDNEFDLLTRMRKRHEEANKNAAVSLEAALPGLFTNFDIVLAQFGNTQLDIPLQQALMYTRLADAAIQAVRVQSRKFTQEDQMMISLGRWWVSGTDEDIKAQWTSVKNEIEKIRKLTGFDPVTMIFVAVCAQTLFLLAKEVRKTGIDRFSAGRTANKYFKTLTAESQLPFMTITGLVAFFTRRIAEYFKVYLDYTAPTLFVSAVLSADAYRWIQFQFDMQKTKPTTALTMSAMLTAAEQGSITAAQQELRTAVEVILKADRTINPSDVVEWMKAHLDNEPDAVQVLESLGMNTQNLTVSQESKDEIAKKTSAAFKEYFDQLSGEDDVDRFFLGASSFATVTGFYQYGIALYCLYFFLNQQKRQELDLVTAITQIFRKIQFFFGKSIGFAILYIFAKNPAQLADVMTQYLIIHQATTLQQTVVQSVKLRTVALEKLTFLNVISQTIASKDTFLGICAAAAWKVNQPGTTVAGSHVIGKIIARNLFVDLLINGAMYGIKRLRTIPSQVVRTSPDPKPIIHPGGRSCYVLPAILQRNPLFIEQNSPNSITRRLLQNILQTVTQDMQAWQWIQNGITYAETQTLLAAIADGRLHEGYSHDEWTERISRSQTKYPALMGEVNQLTNFNAQANTAPVKVDFKLIRERLIGQRTPTRAEMMAAVKRLYSDLDWLLYQTKNPDDVNDIEDIVLASIWTNRLRAMLNGGHLHPCYVVSRSSSPLGPQYSLQLNCLGDGEAASYRVPRMTDEPVDGIALRNLNLAQQFRQSYYYSNPTLTGNEYSSRSQVVPFNNNRINDADLQNAYVGDANQADTLYGYYNSDNDRGILSDHAFGTELPLTDPQQCRTSYFFTTENQTRDINNPCLVPELAPAQNNNSNLHDFVLCNLSRWSTLDGDRIKSNILSRNAPPVISFDFDAEAGDVKSQYSFIRQPYDFFNPRNGNTRNNSVNTIQSVDRTTTASFFDVVQTQLWKQFKEQSVQGHRVHMRLLGPAMLLAPHLAYDLSLIHI